jgi:hypothetical protein
VTAHRQDAALGGRPAGRRTAVAALPLVVASVAIAAVSAAAWLSAHSRQSPVDGSGALSGGEETEATSPIAPTSQDDSERVYRIATKEHVNASAGYRFSYPPGWRLRERGTISKVTSSDGHLVVSFGLGPSGPLRRAYDSLASLLFQAYASVDVDHYSPESILGNVALRMRGHALNNAGQRIRFEVLLLERRAGDAPALGAFAAADNGAGRLPAAARETMSSLEPAGSSVHSDDTFSSG